MDGYLSKPIQSQELDEPFENRPALRNRSDLKALSNPPRFEKHKRSTTPFGLKRPSVQN
jgi:hypothetical protein